MTAPPKRRWFRFSLRTMFVVVTVFACWLGWNLHVVRERKAILAELQNISQVKDEYGFPTYFFRYEGLESNEVTDPTHLAKSFGRDFENCRVSRVRRFLGDESCLMLILSLHIDPKLLERVEYAFPEAVLDAGWGSKTGSGDVWRDSLYRSADKRRPNKGTIFKTGLIPK